MKKIGYLAGMFLISVLFAGCQEIENLDFLDKTAKQRDSIVENVDLSGISVPEEISVYSAALWEKKPEEIARVFLGDGFQEGKTHGEGRTFVKDAGTKKEQGVSVIDGGMAFFGECGHAADNGVNFWGCGYDGVERSDIFQEMQKEYCDTGKISGGEKDKEKVIPDLEKEVSEYLNQAGMEGYGLDAAALFHIQGEGRQKYCLMYWKQAVDGISLSDTWYGNYGNCTVYNYRHQVYNPEFPITTSTLCICFKKDKLVKWYNSCIIHKDKLLGKYPLVPAGKAYQKVKECYPPESVDGETSSLERAELQYQIVSWGEKYYLYPIWLFGVYKKTEMGAEWQYYIVDAVTGDFFSDIPAELLEPNRN